MNFCRNISSDDRVEFYKECKGILWQLNFVKSVKIYCGGGIL